jgi:hypothetical protein
MALIVMMAMPFAMAEEVEVYTDAVEEVVESNDVALEGDDTAIEESASVANISYGFYLTDEGLYDFGGEEVDAIDIGDVDEKKFEVKLKMDDTRYEDYKSTKWTIKPTTAAKVHKESDSTAVVTLKKACDKVTLKVSGKISYDGEDYTKSRHDMVEVTFEITDDHNIDKVKANYSDDEFVPDYPSKDETKSSYNVDIGLGKVVIPFAANKDGESIDYMTDDDVDYDHWGEYNFKWSNKKVGEYVGEFDEKKIFVNDLTEDDMGDYKVLFKKKGSTKVTFTSQYDKKKKASVNFKVSIPEKYDYKADKKYKPSVSDDPKIELVVKSAKYTDVNTLEVEVWVANSSAKDLRGTVDGVVIGTKKNPAIGTDGVMKFTGTIKKQKVGTAKIKFKYSEEESQLHYKTNDDDEEEYGKLFDIDRTISIDEDSVADALAEKGAIDSEDVESNKIEG